MASGGGFINRKAVCEGRQTSRGFYQDGGFYTSRGEKQTYRDNLKRFNNWIQRSKRELPRNPQSNSDASERLAKLTAEIEKRKHVVGKLKALGHQLVEETGGDANTKSQVDKEIQELQESFGALKFAALQAQGHTSKLGETLVAPYSDRIKRRLLDKNSPTDATEYTMVEDRVMRYVKTEHGISIRVKSIEKLKNAKLEERFENVRKILYNRICTNILLIHGTAGSSAENIIKNGFMIGSRAGLMFGAGIYFATDTSKSAQYSRDQGEKTLLVCKVLLGKSWIMNSPRQDLNLETVHAAGYDSVFARRDSKSTGGVANDEYIVYRPEQAVPKYLVKFLSSGGKGM